jgi:DNA-binding CsgD family transcriptional regulator
MPKDVEYSAMELAKGVRPGMPAPHERVPEIFAPLLTVTCEADLVAATTVAMRRLGFETFTYGAAIRFREEWEPWFASWTTLPREWIVRYEERNYLDIDPRIAAGFGSPIPLLWDRRVLGGSPAADAFLDDAARFGLCSGVVIHIPGPGAEHHMTSFNSPRPSCDDIDYGSVGQAYLFAVWFHRWFRDRLVGGTFAHGSRGQPLTARQRECLSYVVRGFTNVEIASGMGITERGVAHHVSQLLAKLEAANRTELVLRAVRDNLVTQPSGR